MAFVTPVVEHWLEREIAQWIHPHEGSIRRPIAPWANALTTELHLTHPFLGSIVDANPVPTSLLVNVLTAMPYCISRLVLCISYVRQWIWHPNLSAANGLGTINILKKKKKKKDWFYPHLTSGRTWTSLILSDFPSPLSKMLALLLSRSTIPRKSFSSPSWKSRRCIGSTSRLMLEAPEIMCLLLISTFYY